MTQRIVITVNKPNLKTAKIVAIMLVVALVASFLTYQITIRAALVGDVTEVYVNGPFSEASYVSGPYNSTFYYVKDGASGNYSYLGTNWAAGINAAIDALPSTGGMIFLRGAGTWTKAVNINDIGIELRGEGKSTKITKGFNGNMIEMNGTAKYFQAVRDLYLSGAKASYTGSGIHLSYTYGTTDAQPILENLWINDMELHGVFAEGGGTREIKGSNIVARICGGDGFYLGGTDGKYNDLVAENCDHHGIETNGGSNQFINCKVFGCGNSGVSYYGGYFGGYWQAIVSCYFQDNEYNGVYMAGQACTMTGSVIQNNGRTSSTASGIVMGSGSDGTIITGNVILDSGGYQDYGIYINSGSQNNVISNNFLDGNDIANIYVGDSLNIVRLNSGFLTENAGSQASCVNGTAIAHGLAGTPTSLSISIFGTNPYVNSTAWYFVPTVLSANSTYFIVSFCMNIGGTYTPVGAADAKTIKWDAVYKP